MGSSSAPLGGPPHRGHDCLLSFCRAFNFVTGLCAVLCALAFGMAMWVRGEAPTKVCGGGVWGGGGEWLLVQTRMARRGGARM